MASYVTDKFNEMFDKYVPGEGKANTVGGEILRAVNRIAYRNFNDGDYFWYDYGIETCGSSAIYLFETNGTFRNWVRYNILYEYGEFELEDLFERTLKYLENNMDLFKEHNKVDSTQDYRQLAFIRFSEYTEEYKQMNEGDEEDYIIEEDDYEENGSEDEDDLEENDEEDKTIYEADDNWLYDKVDESDKE